MLTIESWLNIINNRNKYQRLSILEVVFPLIRKKADRIPIVCFDRPNPIMYHLKRISLLAPLFEMVEFKHFKNLVKVEGYLFERGSDYLDIYKIESVISNVLKFKNLKYLGLGGVEEFDDEQLEMLKQLKELETFKLPKSKIDGEYFPLLPTISKLTNLRKLDLSGVTFTDVDHLAKLVNLEVLRMGKSCIWASGFNALLTLTKLVELDLNNARVTVEKNTLAKLVNLERLYIRKVNIYSGEAFDQLLKLTKLRRLAIPRVKEGVKCMEEITKLPRLHFLWVTDTFKISTRNGMKFDKRHRDIIVKQLHCGDSNNPIILGDAPHGDVTFDDKYVLYQDEKGFRWQRMEIPLLGDGVTFDTTFEDLMRSKGGL